MKLIWIGAHDAVDVPLPTGGAKTCVRGVAEDIPDSLAGGLLEQPTNWQKAAAPKTPPKTKED